MSLKPCPVVVNSIVKLELLAPLIPQSGFDRPGLPIYWLAILLLEYTESQLMGFICVHFAQKQDVVLSQQGIQLCNRSCMPAFKTFQCRVSRHHKTQWFSLKLTPVAVLPNGELPNGDHIRDP